MSRPPASLTRRAVLGGALALPVALAGCGGPDWTSASGTLRVATGNPGAVFDRYGAALAAELAADVPGVVPATVNTAGSVANVRALVAGRAEVAFCLGDTAVLALEGRAPFGSAVPLTAVTRLYDSFLQVFVPADSAVRTVADLRGRRVAAGQTGSGTRLTVGRVLREAGLSLRDATVLRTPLTQALGDLEAERLDAVAFVSGFPIPSVVELAGRRPLRLLDLGDVVPGLVSRFGDQYVEGLLPASAYDLPAAVRTLSIKTHLLAAPTLSDELAHAVAAVIFERQDAVARLVPDVRQPAAAAGIFTQPLPLHPGSLRWFRERGGA